MSNSQCSTLPPAASGLAAPRVGLVPVLGRAVLRLFELLATWQERARERTHLAALDDHYLKDIGLDRAQVQREAAKPFWRA